MTPSNEEHSSERLARYSGYPFYSSIWISIAVNFLVSLIFTAIIIFTLINIYSLSASINNVLRCLGESNCDGDAQTLDDFAYRGYIAAVGLVVGLAILGVVISLVMRSIRRNRDKITIGNDEVFQTRIAKLAAFINPEIGLEYLQELLNAVSPFTTISRMENLLDGLKFQALLSLSIGVMTASFGGFVLMSSIFDEASGDVTVRLGIAAFVQAVAFFFFNSYRSVQADIRFYQNEITLLETRLFSLLYAGSRVLNEEEQEVVSSIEKNRNEYRPMDEVDNSSEQEDDSPTALDKISKLMTGRLSL